MVRDKVVDLEIVHISSKHTTPQIMTLQAGRRVKGAQKNDMEFLFLLLSQLHVVLRVALNAQGARRIAEAIRSNLLTTNAQLALPFMSPSRSRQFFEPINVVPVPLTGVSPATRRHLGQAVFATQVTQLAGSFSGSGAPLRCMQ